MTPRFCNNLRQNDQVFHVGRKQRGIVDTTPRETERRVRVAFDGMVYSKWVDVMDLRFIPPNAVPKGTPEDVPPVDGAPLERAKSVTETPYLTLHKASHRLWLAVGRRMVKDAESITADDVLEMLNAWRAVGDIVDPPAGGRPPP